MANLDLLNLFWKRAEREADWSPYLTEIKKARPFTLDAELTEVVSKLTDTSERRLRMYLQSARLPFPIMWLEAPADLAFPFMRTHEKKWKMRLHEASPTRVGWLLREIPFRHEQYVYSVTRLSMLTEVEDGEPKAVMYPVVHLVSPNQKLNLEGAFDSLYGKIDAGVLRALQTMNGDAMYRRLAWGGDAFATDAVRRRAGEGPWAEAAAQSPLDCCNVAFLEPRVLSICADPERSDGYDSSMARARDTLLAGMEDQRGELAFIAAALGLLNEIPFKEVPYRPQGSLRAGGRMRPFMTSSIVSLEVPYTRRRLRDFDRQLYQKGREIAKRARHEVRGHYKHLYKGLPRSEKNHHRWERGFDLSGRPCWKLWVNKFERGDASIGWVKQSYRGVRGRGRIPGIQEEDSAHVT